MPNFEMTWLETNLSLTKCLDPTDYVILAPDLETVDTHPLGDEQHTHRRWEYAMCIRAIRAWNLARNYAIITEVLDVGGAGSTLPTTIRDELQLAVHVIDPRESVALEDLAKESINVPRTAAIVVSISTIEHVKDEESFVLDLAAAVKPGGLLFLTTDIRGASQEDAFGSDIKNDRHFHWMRERIYSPATWRALGSIFINTGFHYFGPPDWDYHGDHVYDYSFASMALVKGRLA